MFDKARGEFDLEAGHNMSDGIDRSRARASDPAGRESGRPMCRASRGRAVRRADKGAAASAVRDAHKAGVRALLAVPLLHQDQVIGALVVRRTRAGAFAPEIDQPAADFRRAVEPSRYKTRACSTRSSRRAASSRSRASTSRSSSPT